MDNFALVRPEHLNHHGYLFGGALLRWVDEFAWLVASRDFPGCTLVTVALDDIVFRHRVDNGSILRFAILPQRQGCTSITYRVDVYADAPGASSERGVFSTCITFVRLDERGRKLSLPEQGILRSVIAAPAHGPAPPLATAPATSERPPGAGKSSFDLIDRARLFSLLALPPEAVVLDLACGPGDYALELARRLPAGRVQAVDLWPEGIDQLRHAAAAEGLTQLDAMVADAGRALPLANDSVDLCLAATVLHDLVTTGKAAAALENVGRVLRPGGTLAAVEFEKVASEPGPPTQIRLAPEELTALAATHGFRRRRLEPVGDHLYLLLLDRD